MSFDFDGVLCSPDDRLYVETERMLRAHVDAGDEVHLVTSRYVKHGGPSLFAFLTKYNLTHLFAGVHFTEHEYKVHTLRALDVHTHYDDNTEELCLLPDIGHRVFYARGKTR